MRMFAATGAALLLALFVSPAYASPVTFDVGGADDGSSVALTRVDNGVTFGPYDFGWFGTVDAWTRWDGSALSVSLAPGLDDYLFTLNDLESQTIDFLRFVVDGDGVGTFDLTATLAFEEPAALSASSDGSGGWGTMDWTFNVLDLLQVKGSFSGGALTWDDPFTTMTLPDGNLVAVYLENTVPIGFSDTTIVHATIRNFGGGTSPGPNPAPVPEPGTLLLLGSGLAGLAGYGRKRMKR